MKLKEHASNGQIETAPKASDKGLAAVSCIFLRDFLTMTLAQ